MKTMASSASLLRPSTLAPASSPRLPRRAPAPAQLVLRSSPRRPRGVSLTVAAAASPDVQKEPSSSPPPPPVEPSDLSMVSWLWFSVGRGGEREGAQGRGQDEEGAGSGGAGGAGKDQEGEARHLHLLRDARRGRVPRQDVDAHLHRPGEQHPQNSSFGSAVCIWWLIDRPVLNVSQGSKLEKGSYFPVTAVQRFDAAGQRIENGVYLGPAGSLTFEGRLSWKKKMLAFVFERIRVKLGPLPSLEIPFGGGDMSREPSTKDPFFLWFYVDEEIAVAQGKGGGTAFWCRCKRVPA